MDLLFCVEQGLVAGHDVGFSKVDFLKAYLSLDHHAECRKDIIALLERLCVPVGGIRIDGSGAEIADRLWLEQQKKALVIFNEGYETNSCISYLDSQASLVCSERQQTYHDYLLLSARPLRVQSVYDVLSKNEIAFIKSCVKPEKKQCYKNSYNMCMLAGYDYVEGMVNSVIPISHAFSKVRDGVYIDVTLELALGLEVRDLEFVSQLEYNSMDLGVASSASGVYGGYLMDEFISRLNGN